MFFWVFKTSTNSTWSYNLIFIYFVFYQLFDSHGFTGRKIKASIKYERNNTDTRKVALARNNRDSLTMLRCDRTGICVSTATQRKIEFWFPSWNSREKKFYRSLRGSLCEIFLRPKGDFPSCGNEKKRQE